MAQVCRIITLFSGSGGNSTFIQAENTAVLIDAGKSARAVCRALREIGSDIENIQAIFVTHDHRDHIAALEMISKHYGIPIHMTAASAACWDSVPDSSVFRNLICHEPIFAQQVGIFTVTSFRTPHDSRMSVGYRIEWDEGAVRHAVGVATDMGYVSEAVRQGLLGCEAVVLEANHDLEMLEHGSYPYALKQRIRSDRGHLSNTESAELAAFLAANGTHSFLLAHISEENNDPMLAQREVQGAIADVRVCVNAADPQMPTELIWSQSER